MNVMHQLMPGNEKVSIFTMLHITYASSDLLVDYRTQPS